MCLSIPMQVVENEGSGEHAGLFAWVARGDRRERVNMMLIGPQPLGTWVLSALGLAKEVINEDERLLIEDALGALSASLEGDYNPDQHFHDLPRPAPST